MLQTSQEHMQLLLYRSFLNEYRVSEREMIRIIDESWIESRNPGYKFVPLSVCTFECAWNICSSVLWDTSSIKKLKKQPQQWS